MPLPLVRWPDDALPVVVLGNDVALAALPAHPLQLAHACHALGYRHVVPASWGDELVAAAMVHEAALRDRAPLVSCACPLVRDRLNGSAAELEPELARAVAPPVAAARYLRRLFAEEALHVTYVGTCPGGTDPAFDARLLPTELLAWCEAAGVSVSAQPYAFEGVVPPDRRRHFSLPGGAPAPEALGARDVAQDLVVLAEDGLVEHLADALLSRTAAVLDAAPAVGCTCAGGTSGRIAITSLEPPRSLVPVLDGRVLVDLQPGPTFRHGASPPAATRRRRATPLARTPAHSIDATAPATLGEWWGAAPPATSAPPQAAVDLIASASEVPTVELPRRLLEESAGVAPATDIPAPMEREELRPSDTGEAAASIRRRTPSQVRRVPPPRARRWTLLEVALLIAALVVAAWQVLR